MTAMSTNPLADLLRKSPFKPIQEHMRTVFSCTLLLPPLFDALYRVNRDEVNELARQIGKLETEADIIKSSYRLNMPKTLLLPVDRKDLLSLIHEQDSIADGVETISTILTNRDMIVPAGIKGGLDELVEGSMEIVSLARDMIEELDELVHVGFSGREHDKVAAMIDGLRKSEHNIDQILKNVNRSLYTIESALEPVSIIFWYRIIEELGNLSDHSENMADRLLLFLSK